MTPVSKAATKGLPAPWDRLTVDPQLDVPLWLQLKTQLVYTVSTGGAPVGTKLPAVRGLADHLGVAVDTIRRAYDELAQRGLVVTQHGRGTFTALPGDTTNSTSTGAWPVVDEMLRSGISHGVSPAESLRSLRQRLAMLTNGMNIVFVGVRASAQRYARELSERLPSSLPPVGAVELEELHSDHRALGTASHAIVLSSRYREVEELLSDAPVRTLSLVAPLDGEIFSGLPAETASLNAVLVSRPETRENYRRQLADRGVVFASLEFVNDTDTADLEEKLPGADVVFHTSVSAQAVLARCGAQHTVIELRHKPTDKSVHAIGLALTTDLELLAEIATSTAGGKPPSTPIPLPSG
jgi:DNA-binding transcriptional regulator YhcF (GntR family)